MRVFAAGLALVWTLLLGAIAVQLWQINQHLSWVSAPIRSLAVIGERGVANKQTETREQRRERYRREAQEFAEDMEDRLGLPMKARAQGKGATGQPSQKSSPGDSPRQQ